MKTINSFRSKLFALTLALMASVSSFAYDYHGDLLCYNVLTDSTVAVTGQSEYKTMPRYEYLPENLVIPSEVTLQGKTYKVVSIDQWAFYACTMLKSVTIPSSVTFIGLSAFQYCENLVNVDIPTSVTTVEGSAFSYTKWYDNLPDGEVYINNTLYRYKGTAPENTQIVVKDGTTRIAGFTFWNQSNIVAIELPQTLTDIEHGAFEGCTQLSSILIPKNVTFIGFSAFAECTGLKEVICLADTPPIAGVSANPSPSDWMFAGVDVANVRLYVPMESIELYRNADQWKDFQIRIYYGSEECHEYMHVNLTALPLITGKLTYRLSTDDGSEIPYVDSVWILNTDKEPLRKFYAQSGDTIDLLFLERGTYMLNVYLNECIKSRTFVHRPKWKYTWCDTWNVFVENGSVYPPHEETYRYQLAKDTVIGDYTYTAVVSKAINDALDAPRYVAAVRFTDDRKVYIYYDNAEYLLYDFNVQEGDELEVFAGINNYTSEIKTYKCTVTGIEQYACVGCPATITLEVHNHPDDFREFYRQTQWIEGVGDINGFLNGINHYVEMDGGGSEYLLCAYKGDELKYTGPLYEEYGCGDDAEQTPEDLFPTLWGLQRTVCNEYCGETEDDNSANNTYKQTFDKIFFENDKPYILCNGYLLREEDNKIFLYSQSLNKDIVLYDFTLEVGDSLPTYIKDFDGTMYSDDTLVVTDISSVTLLDGKEYKKWTFDNGMEYVEGIGMYGGHRNGNFFGLIQEIVVPCHTGTHLVCVSKNNKILYQMDDAEMERLGAECLCEYNSGPKKDNAKNGKIGGRPTPTQWNMLEVETKEMDGTPTILRAETFSYTLENDSIVANNKTYYQLARQSTKDTAITKSFVGALHFGEDEDNRVYFLHNGVEYVLYDFTAEIGDTVEIFAGINNYPQESTYTHVVVDKDTTEDGACRMFLEVVFPDETTTATNEEKVWLAGLGSIDGIVHNAAKRTSDVHAAPAKSASSETQSSVMLCAWREDSCLYTTNHPEYDTFGCVYNQDPTAVENLTSPSSYQKIIHEGTLLILHEGKVYNVIGIQIK